MIGKDVKLIEYSEKVDFLNGITHFAGAVLAVVGFIMLVSHAVGTRNILAAIVYGMTLVAVYTVSSVYHFLPKGEKKRKARIADHSTVPFLIAGTATPCALISLYNLKPSLGITVFVLGWLCTLFGLVSKLFFFEKLKSVTMVVYIVSGFIMLCSVIPVADKINMGAFRELIYGCLFYICGAVLCGLGRKYQFLHIIFHLFVILGSAFHFYVIYRYII